MMITSEEISILSSLRNEIDRLKYDIDQVDKIENNRNQRGYSGNPIPCREGIEIDIDSGNTDSPLPIGKKFSGSFVISADGPYVATGYHFAFRYNNKTEAGVDLSGFWRSMAITQFYYEYQSTGVNRKRQKTHVPSYVYERSEFGNGFFPLIPHDVFAKTSTITITVETIDTAFLNYGYRGKLWFGFNGYYLLD